MVQALVPTSQIEPLFDVRPELAITTDLSNEIGRRNYDDGSTGQLLEQALSLLAAAERNLSTTLRHRRFLFTDSFLLLWKWRVG